MSFFSLSHHCMHRPDNAAIISTPPLEFPPVPLDHNPAHTSAFLPSFSAPLTSFPVFLIFSSTAS